LNDIKTLAANDAWAVGDEGLLLRWNGTEWATVTSPTTYDLYAVDFVTPSDGWAVGGEWINPTECYKAVYLHWDGSTWTSYSPVMISDLLYDIDMISSTYGIAVGHNNVQSAWNGNAWSAIGTTPMMHYQAVYLLTANDGWAVGWDYTDSNIQHWDGSVWAEVACPTTAGLYDLHMLTTTQGWAVGDTGTILRYSP
jgi:photosystem II stability/assembly factor-like uncharacterized protein